VLLAYPSLIELDSGLARSSSWAVDQVAGQDSPPTLQLSRWGRMPAALVRSRRPAVASAEFGHGADRLLASTRAAVVEPAWAGAF